MSEKPLNKPQKRLTAEAKAFIDREMQSNPELNYDQLLPTIKHRFKLNISKATLTKRAKALRIKFQRGRKNHNLPERPNRALFLDGAGGFFLKGAELEMGLLAAINQLLKTGSESRRAQKALRLAQQINALLLYAPLFGLTTAEDIVDYRQPGLLYLCGQTELPSLNEIEQYLRFLVDQKLLPNIIKEVTKTQAEISFVQIDIAEQTFYLDAQLRTVWPNPNIPPTFSATVYKIKSCLESIFAAPDPAQPLILQTSPGYTVLPPEMFSLIAWLERTSSRSLAQISLMSKSGTLFSWGQNIQPKPKGYFIAPLSPWQYAQLKGMQIIQDFQDYRLGPEQESVAIAEAQVNLYNAQANENVKVRVAMVKRGSENLALITNISRGQQRYIRQIAEIYFARWPGRPVPTYYDLLEQAHAQALERPAPADFNLTPFLTGSYGQKPEDVFGLFLELLHRYALNHFFPPQYQAESLLSMANKFYQHNGYLRDKRDMAIVALQPFSDSALAKAAQAASQKFNQSGIKTSAGKRLYLNF